MTREQYLLIRRIAAKKASYTRQLNKLLLAGVSINSKEVQELIKLAKDFENSAKVLVN